MHVRRTRVGLPRLRERELNGHVSEKPPPIKWKQIVHSIAVNDVIKVWCGVPEINALPRIHFNVADIGNTPVRELSVRVVGRPRRVFLKLDQFNPSGSIRDRTAYGIVRSLMDSGRLQPGGTVVKPTSSNLRISLAYMSKEWNFSFVAVVDSKVSGRADQVYMVATRRDLGIRLPR
jgi:pyridoxal-phosphate dependent enzyme